MKRLTSTTVLLLVMCFAVHTRAEEHGTVHDIEGFADRILGATESVSAGYSATATREVMEDSSATDTAEMTEEIPGGEPPSGMVERLGAVIKVSGLEIYVNQGAIDGVEPGVTMYVYRMEPIKDLDGEVLDEEEVPVGTIEITEVRPRISIGEVVSLDTGPEGGTTPVQRGFSVRYYSSSEAERLDMSAGRCPPGMLYDGGGPFLFNPGSHFTDISHGGRETGETGPFCIDRYPAENDLSWIDARQECAQLGKRLCDKSELQKVCAVWDRPEPCPPDIEDPEKCPEPQTVVDFRKTLEWVSVNEFESGQLSQKSYMCSCPGIDPVCVGCYYERCRGASKKYRCCRDPYPE